jgi:hypothetical protein
MQTALGFGTRDARPFYHAGMIAAAVGDPARARTQSTRWRRELRSDVSPARPHTPSTRHETTLLAGLALASVAAAVVPGIASASARLHHVTTRDPREPDRVLLDVVMKAEIPALRRASSTTPMATASGRRRDRGGPAGRLRIAPPALHLDVAGGPRRPRPRRDCRSRPALAVSRRCLRVRGPAGLADHSATLMEFRDTVPGRIGWREIVISGSATTWP